MTVRLLAAATVMIGLLGAGSGFRNGDAAVYAAQAWSGDLFARWTHVGWVAFAAALAPVADDALPLWLDAATAALAGVGVLLAATLADRRGASPQWAALAAMIALVPEASLAEVDVPWVVALLAAAVAPRGVDAVATVAAVACSPTALLGVPWVVGVRRPEDRWGVIAGAILAVAVLSVASGGAWWWGDRGVLHAQLAPGASISRWVLATVVFAGPVATVAAQRRSAVPLLALAGIAAPADVPAWVLAQIAVGVEVRSPVSRPLRVAWGAAALASVVFATTAIARVREENAALRVAVAQLPPGQPLVARWSDGVRASVLATRDPYGLCWRAPRAAPDPRARCGAFNGRATTPAPVRER